MSRQAWQPLSRHKVFESTIADEIQDNLCKFYSDSKVHIEPINRQRELPHAMCAAKLGSIELTSLCWPKGVDATAPQVEGIFDFCSALSGKATVTVGARRVSVDKSCGVILSPHRPMRFCVGEGSLHFNLKIRQSVIESHCRGLTGHAIDEPLEFDEALRFDDNRLASSWRFVRFMAEEIERDENVLSQPLIGERFAETVLTAILYAQPHNYSELLVKAAPAASPSYVRRAEEYMEAHCDQPITAELLADAVGVSIRTLYAGFRKHRDYPPMEFLRSVRLRRARVALLTAPPDSSVSECALKWGFTHLGRFSALYRKQFAESPSETLRRSRS